MARCNRYGSYLRLYVIKIAQISEKQPDDYCKILNLAAPLKISAKLRDSNFVDLYNILIGVALNPYVIFSLHNCYIQHSFF